MKQIIVLMCLLGTLMGCTFKSSPDSGNAKTYTLDSINPR